MTENPSEHFRTVPNGSEPFGNLPNASEDFGTVRNTSETFRTVPHVSERKENHTLTVREAAKMFETAGVARTERSIINWCQPNRTGVARLDAYFDPNERRYFVTPQSVEAVISEEKAKAAKINTPEISENFGKIPNDTHRKSETTPPPFEDVGKVRELEREIMDLKIANRGKDMFIEQMGKDRAMLLQEVSSSNRRIGQLETRLLQLGAPADPANFSDKLPNLSETESQQ
jgi:hypothetical protein